MSSSSRRPRLPRGRAGFTLVEMLAAMVIASILAITLYRLVQNQSRFVAVQGAREEAQQNARGALDVVSGELRTVNPGGLIEATNGALTFMLPRAWGLVCDAGTSATQMSVIFPDLPADLIVAGSGAGVLVDVSAVGSGALPDWQPSPPSVSGTRATIAAATPINLASGTNPCAAAGYGAAAGAQLTAYTLDGTNFPAARQRGSLVMVYQLARYAVQTSDGRQWLYRSNGMESSGTSFSMMPLAGPVDSVRFTYFRGTAGTRLTSAPGTDATILSDLSRIQIKVSTASRNQVSGVAQRQTDSTTVLLRNRSRAVTP